MTRHLLIIGAQRSGTTYLYRILDDHPEIAMAKPMWPEPKVFLDPAKAHRSLTWYEQTYFSEAGKALIHGEKSTSYIESPKAAERAAEMLPGAQIVVMLRDPVERAISNWRYSTASGAEDRPLARALAENLSASRPWDATQTSVSPFAYLERGHYIEYVMTWARAFPGRLHVLFLEEFTGNGDLVSTLYKTLGVDAAHRPATLTQIVNAAAAPREDVAVDLLARLRKSFAASDERLAEWLNRSLPWRE